MNDAPDPETLESQQAQIESAAAAVHFWRGKPLLWTFIHSTCFQRLGVFGQGVTSNLEAAAAIVYLGLLQSKADIDRIDAARDMGSVKALRMEIARWADAEGLTMNNADGKACNRAADVIWTDAERSRFEPVIDTGGKKKGQGQAHLTGQTISRKSRKSSPAQ